MPSIPSWSRRGPILATALMAAFAFDLRRATAESETLPIPEGFHSPARIAAPNSRPGWSLRAPQATILPVAPTFEQRLDREARRRGVTGPAQLSPDDDEAALDRARSAEKIFTRAVRGMVDERADALARTLPGLGDALRWLDGLGVRSGGRAAQAQTASPGPPGSAPAAEAARPSPFDAAVRMRIDAHPRLELRARAGSLTGLVEVPLLEREMRVGLEQPLGRFGKAAIRGGRNAEEGTWADVMVGIRF